jgi:hypothetical protein
LEKTLNYKLSWQQPRPGVEEYKAKIAKLELDNMEKQNIINTLCGSVH